MKKLKYTIGALVMLSCWAIGIYEVRRPNKAPAPAPEITPAVPAPVADPLPLPEKASEAEIIGLEFALYDPIPERVKKSAKGRK